MNKHQTIKLSDVCQIESGGTPSSSDPSYWDGDIPWATLVDVKNKYVEFTNRRISLSGLNNSSAKILPIGTVLFSSRATIGNVSISKIELATNQGFKNFICDADKLIPGYLYYCLKNEAKRIEASCPGTTYKEISKSTIGKYTIPLPVIEDQKRIVRILDKADALRQKRKQAISLLDDYLKSVFLEMFGDPVKNPIGWETKKLEKLCDIRRGASPRPIKDFIGNDVAWIKIGDATNGDDVYITETKVKIKKEGESKSVVVNEGDLIFANCGVSLGFARIMKIKGCVHDGWLVFQNIDSRVNKMFLLKLINHITNYFQGIAPDGTQPNLNTEIMKNFSVILPGIKMQNKFARLVNEHQTLKQKMLAQSEQLENQFQALMQKAFKGKL